MNKTPFLAMFFDAPMQSYGVESLYDRRTTLPFPTRSAVTGILCAAMGIERDDREFLAKMAELTMETLELSRPSINEKTGKPQISPSRLIDYHTVGGGYDDKNPAQKSHIPRRSDGKTVGTAQSYREYLIDARFGVLVSGDGGLVERCHRGLVDPRWGVWFGRKCCVPASPIDQGIFECREDAVRHLCRRAGCEKPRRVVRDAPSFDAGEETRMDIPVTFERSRRGSGGEYLPRRIVIDSE